MEKISYYVLSVVHGDELDRYYRKDYDSVVFLKEIITETMEDVTFMRIDKLKVNIGALKE